jgi:predicted phosphoadenosine phosphosulfate sulfurtransferase
VCQYVDEWKKKGYSDDIPDVVPDVLQRELLAPSYKAIASAILKNDIQLLSCGFTGKESLWYGELKRVELEARDTRRQRQGKLF